jgi:hypothetical protein
MTLTTARLDEMEARHQPRRSALSPEYPPYCPECSTEWPCDASVLIEAARESVARQECCDVGDKPGLVSLTEHSAPGDGHQWGADWLVPFHIIASSGFQPTPVAAYLTLRDALRATKPMDGLGLGIIAKSLGI